jgi:hypothetical protein
MKFNDNEKNEIINNLNKIIKKTYMVETGNAKIDNQYLNMKDVLDYYNRTNNIDFQKTTLQNLSESSFKSLSFESLLNDDRNGDKQKDKDKDHDRNDDKQKDEGEDINLEKSVNEQIDKSIMPSDKIDKEGIMQELAEMTEEEKDITSKDVKSIVKAATIKAIYKATLEKYEDNRKRIMEHADIVRRRDGDFALEDRLAAENRMYEVYLQKLSKQYSSILPSHKAIENDKKIAAKQKDIKDEHNKEEEAKEKKREEDISRIVLLYNKKEKIEEEMAHMALNPATFDKEAFQTLQNELYEKDKELASMKSSPDVLIENINRDDRQEEIDGKEFGVSKETSNTPIAKTSTGNEQKEEKNNNIIKEKTEDSLETTSANIEEVKKEYYKCRNQGDYEGAREKLEILRSLSGSKENLEKPIQDLTDDGKEEYHTDNEKDDEMKENLGIDKSSINDEDRAAELDAMDAEVEEIAKNNGVKNKEMYDNEKKVSQDEPKQHTLGGNKRPW